MLLVVKVSCLYRWSVSILGLWPHSNWHPPHLLSTKLQESRALEPARF